MSSYDHLMNRLGKLPQADKEDGPDFELEPCSGPLWEVVAFLEARPKLGPAGRSLYSALTGFKPLTEAQEELLIKVLAKLQHSEWLEPILQEMESTLQALAAVDAESSKSHSYGSGIQLMDKSQLY